MRSEFFIEQHLADRLHTKRGEHAEAKFGQIAVGRFARQSRRFRVGLRATRADPDRAVVLDLVDHDLVAELHRQSAMRPTGLSRTFPFIRHDIGFARRQIARRSGGMQKSSGRVFIDFETSWCGPCKTMDDWIWTDKDVAAALAADYVLVKLDGDIEKAAVARFKVAGYPTMVIVDPATGAAVKSVSGYKSSAQILAFVR